MDSRLRICFTLLCLCTGYAIPQEIREYCPHQRFEGTCGQNEVVVMLTANYGRMRLGQCVKKDLGYVGCYSDLLEVADHLCSGRHECEFRIPDMDVFIRNTGQPCLEELKSYLEASYTCVRVHSADAGLCRSSDHVKVTSPDGYLASVTSEETGCGTGGTPWVIEQKPGQQINVTLLDFSVLDIKKSDSSLSLGQPCHAYAIIREKDVREAVTVCGGQQRERHVYLSRTNTVEIRIFSRKKTANFPYFLLRYEAVGCADLILGSNYEFRRNGRSGIAKCKTNGDTWTLTCSGATWSGRVGNCSNVMNPSLGEVVLGNISISFEISVIIITVIASFISICILVIGVVCLRQKRAAAIRANQSQYVPRQVTPPAKPLSKPRQSLVSQNPNGTLRRDGNEYACILEMPLPPPPPGDVKPVTPLYPDGTDHVEAIPYTTQYESSIGSQDNIYPDDPRYFELDPEGLPAGMHAHGQPQDNMHLFSMHQGNMPMDNVYDPSRYNKHCL